MTFLVHGRHHTYEGVKVTVDIQSARFELNNILYTCTVSEGKGKARNSHSDIRLAEHLKTLSESASHHALWSASNTRVTPICTSSCLTCMATEPELPPQTGMKTNPGVVSLILAPAHALSLLNC